jgi:hypothetical protein
MFDLKDFVKQAAAGIEDGIGLFRHKFDDTAVFDFSDIDLSDKTIPIELRNEAEAAFRSGNLSLPFKKCIFIANDSCVAAAYHQDSNIINVGLFLLSNGKWQTIPCSESLNRAGPDETIVRYSQVEFALWDSNNPDGCKKSRGAATSTLIASYLLALPKSHTELLVPPPKATNQLRRARGLEPLPPIRVIRLDVVWLRQYLPKGSHHASPVPHERRGHYRRLNNGVMVWVRESCVRGGGKKPYVAMISDLLSEEKK